MDQVKANSPYLKKLAINKAKSFARQNFPKLVKKTSNMLEKKLGKKNKDLAIKAGKSIGRNVLKSSSGKIQSFAKKNKDKNFITAELYKELFSNRNIIEDGLRQLGGKRKQIGGSIYMNEADYFSSNKSLRPLRDSGITDRRYNRLGY